MHSWKRSQLGLNYSGSYTRYSNYENYNSTNHSLSLGYTDQISSRLMLDLRESVGSLTYGTGLVADAASADLNTSFTPVARLFDTRSYFLQSSASVTYIKSARVSYTAGIGGFFQNLKSEGLSNAWGYNLDGSVRRRLSKRSTLGATYAFSHFEFPLYASTSHSHTFHGLYAAGLGQFWTLSIEAGATLSQGEGVVTFALNPVLAAIFGQPTIQTISSYSTLYPSGKVELKRQFRRALLGFNYYRGVNSGNGAYTTARLDTAGASISYTGLRKVNLGADGGYYSIHAIGQHLENFSQFSAGAGVSYALGRDIHLTLRYDYRDQQIDLSSYKHTGSRAAIGLNYSPGSLPLSLW